MLTLVEEKDAGAIVVPSFSPPGARQALTSRRTGNFLFPSPLERGVYPQDSYPESRCHSVLLNMIYTPIVITIETCTVSKPNDLWYNIS